MTSIYLPTIFTHFPAHDIKKVHTNITVTTANSQYDVIIKINEIIYTKNLLMSKGRGTHN